jgi:hypothetical protein
MKTNQNIRTIPIDGRAEFEREMRKIISVTKKTLKKKVDAAKWLLCHLIVFRANKLLISSFSTTSFPPCQSDCSLTFLSFLYRKKKSLVSGCGMPNIRYESQE